LGKEAAAIHRAAFPENRHAVSFGCVVRPKADRDIDDIAEYLADHAGLELAIRFLTEAYETFGIIATQPEMGWQCRISHPQMKLARTFRVSDRFKEYMIFYQPYGDRIEVMRVLNGSQDLVPLFGQEDAVDPA
jgi:plasmid stabilization system protein ParE